MIVESIAGLLSIDLDRIHTIKIREADLINHGESGSEGSEPGNPLQRIAGVEGRNINNPAPAS